MQRPDGRYAVLLRDITATSRAAFVAVGESGMDVDVLEADTRLVRLRLPGGEVRELAPGATVQIGAASP
jgi:ribosomal protein L2